MAGDGGKMIYANTTRAKVLAFLGLHPGAVRKEVTAGCGLPKNSVYYHAKLLVGLGYVSCVEVSHQLDCWYFLTEPGRAWVRSQGGTLTNDC